MEEVFEYLARVIANFLAIFVSPGSFLGPLPLLVALVVAVAVVFVRCRHRSIPLRRLARLLFPRGVFLHRSSLQDWAILAINGGLLYFLVDDAAPATPVVTDTLTEVASWLGLKPDAAAAAPSLFELVLFSIYLMLVWDFAATSAHYLKHRVPVLWEFHKVHHCAPVMTPVTAFRRHPVEAVFGGLVTGVLLGLAVVLWRIVFGSPVESPLTILGVSAGVYLWRLLGYNLRHTHIWISYGPFWSRIFISPAQHQVHHSDDPRHFDTNFGHIFAFWDRLFGTLYVPAPGERVRFGIEAEDMARMHTLRGIYWAPFVQVARLAVQAGRRLIRPALADRR